MKALSSTDIKELLSEADALIQKIHTEFTDEVEEEKRLQLEARRADLEASRENVASITENRPRETDNRPSSGIHEAIDDLVSAIKETSRILT